MTSTDTRVPNPTYDHAAGLGLVLDMSGNMAGHFTRVARAVILQLEDLPQNNTWITLMLANSDVVELSHRTLLSHLIPARGRNAIPPRPELTGLRDRAFVAGGCNSALWTAVKRTSESLHAVQEIELKRRVVCVITYGPPSPTATTLELLPPEGHRCETSIIHITPSGTRSPVYDKICQETGGQYKVISGMRDSAPSCKGVIDALSEIANRLVISTDPPAVSLSSKSQSQSQPPSHYVPSFITSDPPRAILPPLPPITTTPFVPPRKTVPPPPPVPTPTPATATITTTAAKTTTTTTTPGTVLARGAFRKQRPKAPSPSPPPLPLPRKKTPPTEKRPRAPLLVIDDGDSESAEESPVPAKKQQVEQRPVPPPSMGAYDDDIEEEIVEHESSEEEEEETKQAPDSPVDTDLEEILADVSGDDDD